MYQAYLLTPKRPTENPTRCYCGDNPSQPHNLPGLKITRIIISTTRGQTFPPRPHLIVSKSTPICRYRNQPGLSGSGPLAAASRYGAKGTLRMIRRDASASRGGEGREEDDTADDFQVDEWSPMLRCSTAPSLATTTTPKVGMHLLGSVVASTFGCALYSEHVQPYF